MFRFWMLRKAPINEISKSVPPFNRGLSKRLHGLGMNANAWKRLTLIVAAPTILLCMANVLVNSKEKPSHQEPFVKYEYLRRRNKRFPWGDGERSLFHNSKTNALSTGYEN